MKFVDDIRGIWRHYSTIALTAAGGLQGAWVSIPNEIKANLPATVGQAVSWISLCIVVLGLFGKFVKQPGVENEPKP